MNKNSNFENSLPKESYEKEIDLRDLIYLILRNKVLIGSVASIFLVLASIYSLTLKKIWEGQFQIVLDSAQTNNKSNLNFNLNNLLIDKQNNNLSTQVGILKSPSVLMPIFDFINEKNNKNFNSQKTFDKWKNNRL